MTWIAAPARTSGTEDRSESFVILVRKLDEPRWTPLRSFHFYDEMTRALADLHAGISPNEVLEKVY